MEQPLSQAEKFNEFIYGQVMGVLYRHIMTFMKGSVLSTKEKDIVWIIRNELQEFAPNLGFSLDSINGPDLDQAVNNALEKGKREGLWYKTLISSDEIYMMGLVGAGKTRELFKEYGHLGVAIFNAITNKN